MINTQMRDYEYLKITEENDDYGQPQTVEAEGTIKMITIGAFITIACGVLLITNKKMSVIIVVVAKLYVPLAQQDRATAF